MLRLRDGVALVAWGIGRRSSLRALGTRSAHECGRNRNERFDHHLGRERPNASLIEAPT